MDRHPNAKTAVNELGRDMSMSRYATELPNQPPLSNASLERRVTYRGYRELLESWAGLPNARRHQIGQSVSGEPLWMVEIGNPEATNVSVVIAGIHPIEWIGIETAFALAQGHAEKPSENRRVCFFPLANPDGFRKVEANVRAGRRKWVRSNDNGVDLNRNWPTHFREQAGLIAGHNASGPAPCSEPEVAAIVAALDALARRANLDFALSLHSIGNMILMPWGGVWKSPVAREQHLRIANKLKYRLGAYTVRQVSRWVPGVSFAHGMEIDHLHEAYEATAILIECTRGELGLRKPGVLLDPFRIFNPRDGRVEAARIATAVDPFIRGKL